MKNRIINACPENEQVRTALLLAAGTGSRLAPLTDMTPKCLVPVNEISILERLIHSLQVHNFKRLVIVVGHQADCIRNFLGTRAGGMEITYIHSPLYKTTNNIYSLWLARKVINEPFLLIESDLVFAPEMLKEMLYPDRIAVGKFQPWMNGTTVKINSTQEIEAFCCGAHKHDDNHYKTVNIYSLSTMTWQLLQKRLEQHISNNKVNAYYETVLEEMVNEGCLSFTPVFFDTKRWYEIDTIADLQVAEQMSGLRLLPAANITDCAVHYPNDHNLPVSIQINSIHRLKGSPRRHPISTVSALMRPTSSTLAQ